jgi:hypothetical protein
MDAPAALLGLALVALAVAAVGVAVGILVVAPRITAWMDRDEEPRDDG